MPDLILMLNRSWEWPSSIWFGPKGTSQKNTMKQASRFFWTLGFSWRIERIFEKVKSLEFFSFLTGTFKFFSFSLCTNPMQEIVVHYYCPRSSKQDFSQNGKESIWERKEKQLLKANYLSTALLVTTEAQESLFSVPKNLTIFQESQVCTRNIEKSGIFEGKFYYVYHLL